MRGPAIPEYGQTLGDGLAGSLALSLVGLEPSGEARLPATTGVPVMAKDLRFPSMPFAEEYDVGDDSDLPGYDQPITQDDIDAVVNSSRGTVKERRELLLRMLDDLRARQGMDESAEYGALVESIRGALAALGSPPEGIGTPGAYAHDPADRAMQPDEVLERAEDEARTED
jgi:hypothetical protein